MRGALFCVTRYIKKSKEILCSLLQSFQHFCRPVKTFSRISILHNYFCTKMHHSISLGVFCSSISFSLSVQIYHHFRLFVSLIIVVIDSQKMCNILMNNSNMFCPARLLTTMVNVLCQNLRAKRRAVSEEQSP